MQKILCNSTDLYKKLLAIKDAVPSNPVIPILENFLFEVNAGELTMTASTLQISLQTKIDVQSEGDFSAAVPAKMLLQTLKELPQQPLTIDFDVNDMALTIQASTGSYKMSFEDAQDFPKQGGLDGGMTFSFDSDVLQKALASTLRYASDDDLKPAMNGIYIIEDEDSSRYAFVATDSHRLTEFKMTGREREEGEPLLKVLIPAKALEFIKAKFADGDIELAYDKNKAVIDTGEVVMTARLIDERFPDYENVIPDTHSKKLVVSKADLIQSLKRVMIYANQTSKQIKLECKDNSVIVSAEDADFSNEAKEIIHANYEGEEEFQIGFNGNYLVEGLMGIPAEMVMLCMTEPNRAAIIKPEEGAIDEDYEEAGVQIQHLIMPLMLSNYY